MQERQSVGRVPLHDLHFGLHSGHWPVVVLGRPLWQRHEPRVSTSPCRHEVHAELAGKVQVRQVEWHWMAVH